MDEFTLKDYRDAASSWPVSVVERVCDGFRLGRYQRKDKAFAPSLEALLSKLKIERMNDAEQAEFRRMNGLPPALPKPKEEDLQVPLSPEKRREMSERLTELSRSLES